MAPPPYHFAFPASKSQDHYTVIGVPPHTSRLAIKQMYRAKVLKVHPDKLRIRTAASATAFQALSAAWEVLGDGARRAEYDRVRALDEMGKDVGVGEKRKRDDGETEGEGEGERSVERERVLGGDGREEMTRGERRAAKKARLQGGHASQDSCLGDLKTGTHRRLDEVEETAKKEKALAKDAVVDDWREDHAMQMESGEELYVAKSMVVEEELVENAAMKADEIRAHLREHMETGEKARRSREKQIFKREASWEQPKAKQKSKRKRLRAKEMAKLEEAAAAETKDKPDLPADEVHEDGEATMKAAASEADEELEIPGDEILGDENSAAKAGRQAVRKIKMPRIKKLIDGTKKFLEAVSNHEESSTYGVLPFPRPSPPIITPPKPKYKFVFQALPAEIRDMIYFYALHTRRQKSSKQPSPLLRALRNNPALKAAAEKVFYQSYDFKFSVLKLAPINAMLPSRLNLVRYMTLNVPQLLSSATLSDNLKHASNVRYLRLVGGMPLHNATPGVELAIVAKWLLPQLTQLRSVRVDFVWKIKLSQRDENLATPKSRWYLPTFEKMLGAKGKWSWDEVSTDSWVWEAEEKKCFEVNAIRTHVRLDGTDGHAAAVEGERAC